LLYFYIVVSKLYLKFATLMHLLNSSSVDENRESAMARAEEIQSSLPAEHPSFVKHMLRSHVVKGFWLVSWYLLCLPNA